MLMLNEPLVGFGKGASEDSILEFVSSIPIVRFKFEKQFNWLFTRKKKRIFNICASQPIQMLKLVSIINSKLKLQSQIALLPRRKGEILKTYGSNILLKKVFKFKNFTDINNGLNKTILFFKKYNY